MKPIAALLLLLAAGCSGFQEPTPERLTGLPFGPPLPAGSVSLRTVSVRFQMSLDSPWLAGEFEGIALGRTGGFELPKLRAQLFGDLGPKVAELGVDPDRIVGYFPQTREAVDCAIPGEATAHPLLFMGASLAQELLSSESESDIDGVREEPEGTWLRLRPFFKGTEVHRLMSRGNPDVKRRRFWWMLGVHWEEEWVSPTECRISAPNLTMRVRILNRTKAWGTTAAELGLKLPDDVRIVAGSRK